MRNPDRKSQRGGVGASREGARDREEEGGGGRGKETCKGKKQKQKREKREKNKSKEKQGKFRRMSILVERLRGRKRSAARLPRSILTGRTSFETDWSSLEREWG